MMKLNVELLAEQLGLQLLPTSAGSEKPPKVNMDKLEAQMSTQNKRFKIINNEYNQNKKKTTPISAINKKRIDNKNNLVETTTTQEEEDTDKKLE